MKYPIVAYGDPVLRKECRDIEKGEIDVKKLSDDMFETMYAASGVGLAAPQIGKDIRMFIVDGHQINENLEEKTFINAEILEETGEEWAYEEGCLSIPDVRADIYRPETLTIRYFDTDWNEHTEVYDDMAARIIQHEYDHIDGILFTDLVSPLKKQCLKETKKSPKRIVKADYKMRFY
ncbi:UNVERIFIED_CONTAM: hypothetical protein GTU68_057704 [Idotea baltica]|nr:hypothetical protein [Idotea baltica]